MSAVASYCSLGPSVLLLYANSSHSGHREKREDGRSSGVHGGPEAVQVLAAEDEEALRPCLQEH